MKKLSGMIKVANQRLAWIATAEEKAEVYRRALESVSLINEVIAGNEKDEDDLKVINLNVEYLEKMKQLKNEDLSSFWASENFTTIDKAITDGKAYVA